MFGDDAQMHSHSGGMFRLGGDASSGGGSNTACGVSRETARELRAQAALSRMTAEEEEVIQQHCGCREEAKFLLEGLNPKLGPGSHQCLVVPTRLAPEQCVARLMKINAIGADQLTMCMILTINYRY